METLGDLAAVLQANSGGGAATQQQVPTAWRGLSCGPRPLAAVADALQTLAGIERLRVRRPALAAAARGPACPPQRSTRKRNAPRPAPQLAELEGAVRQLLQARRGAQLQAAALQELKGGYAASGQPTDFEAQLAAGAERHDQQQP